ncbi:MAG: hypothetical protein WAM58_08820 [Candidatus Acidiferrum sp.]
MKRVKWAVMLFLLACAMPARAQMGMDMFKRPSFTKMFHPVVGKGAEYETTSKTGSDSKVRTMDMGIVGKESVDGKDGYWMEMMMSEPGGKTILGKMLMTPDDFQFHKMIFQMPGKGAMEMPFNPSAAQRTKLEENMQDWRSAGTESVTVPAGTFVCEHWKNDKTGGDVWVSDKVSPFGLVKEMNKDHSMVLTKVLNDYPERITGPVQKFDPQMMMQQMQQQRQQQPPQ